MDRFDKPATRLHSRKHRHRVFHPTKQPRERCRRCDCGVDSPTRIGHNALTKRAATLVWLRQRLATRSVLDARNALARCPFWDAWRTRARALAWQRRLRARDWTDRARR